MKIKLPEIDKQRSLQKEAMQDPAVYKEYMKKQGILPTTPESDEERPFYTACTQGAIDTYVPPEGEGKATLTGAGSSVTKVSTTVDELIYYSSHTNIKLPLKKSNFFKKRGSK